MNNIEIIICFLVYFLVIIAISIYTSRSINSLSGYMLGNRSLSAPVTAMGVGAADMSGFLLLGIPGAILLTGLTTVWIPIGLALGAYLNWRLIAKRLRVFSEEAHNSLTLPAYLDDRFHDTSGILRIITATVILIFFTFYAAAGFVGGALLFSTIFGINYYASLFVGAGFIVLYTAIGGFLALNRIDVLQGSLMFIALIAVPIMAITSLRGIGQVHADLQVINLHYYTDMFTEISILGAISLLAWGLGYFGQPHILARFMAIRSPKDIPTARRIHITWMVLALTGAVLTGLVGRLFFMDAPLDDAETVFLELVALLFNPWVGGLFLAAVLAAIMSTIAAQLLASASALTEDFYHRFFRSQASQKELVWVSRLTVVLVTVAAVSLSHPNNTVLDLVGYAWGGLGAAFGPVILLSLFWARMTRNGAIIGMICGALGVIVWNWLKPFGGIFELYELLPGFIVGTSGVIVGSLLDKKPSRTILIGFISMMRGLKN